MRNKHHAAAIALLILTIATFVTASPVAAELFRWDTPTPMLLSASVTMFASVICGIFALNDLPEGAPGSRVAIAAAAASAASAGWVFYHVLRGT